MTPIEKKQFEAFTSGLLPELFQSITHQHEIIYADPSDVDVIHKEAREQLESLIRRVSSALAASGRILLLKGDSGAGKTPSNAGIQKPSSPRWSRLFCLHANDLSCCELSALHAAANGGLLGSTLL